MVILFVISHSFIHFTYQLVPEFGVTGVSWSLLPAVVVRRQVTLWTSRQLRAVISNNNMNHTVTGRVIRSCITFPAAFPLFPSSSQSGLKNTNPKIDHDHNEGHVINMGNPLTFHTNGV